MTQGIQDCVLCTTDGGHLVFRGEHFRVIRANEPGFPAFYRLVWNRHVAEWTDLTPPERSVCMQGVAKIETVLREQLQPTKINLATLGNVVPHLHWHVIARFDWDSHFPAPVWAAAVREADAPQLAALQARCAAVDAAIAQSLAQASFLGTLSLHTTQDTTWQV
jgi:diadenosine tetraphosphate (Ap4A) HIT family hydrolase